jgi:hypothetical protein
MGIALAGLDGREPDIARPKSKALLHRGNRFPKIAASCRSTAREGGRLVTRLVIFHWDTYWRWLLLSIAVAYYFGRPRYVRRRPDMASRGIYYFGVLVDVSCLFMMGGAMVFLLIGNVAAHSGFFDYVPLLIALSGILKDVPPTGLGAQVVREAMARARWTTRMPVQIGQR